MHENKQMVKIIRHVSLLHFLFDTINSHSGGLLRYFKQNLHDGSLPNPTVPLPVFHHRESYAQKAKFKLKPLKNPHVRMPVCFATEQLIHALCYPLQSKVSTHARKSFPIDNTLCNGC